MPQQEAVGLGIDLEQLDVIQHSKFSFAPDDERVSPLLAGCHKIHMESQCLLLPGQLGAGMKRETYSFWTQEHADHHILVDLEKNFFY